MKSALKWSLRVGGASALGAAAFFAGRAWAAGIPAAPGALSYSGTLEDGSGRPLEGERVVEARLWPTPTPGTTPLCTSSPQTVTLRGGRFSVPLDGCVNAIKANPNVWVEIKVGADSLGTTKVNSVPYAIESGHAIAADTAATANTATTATTATTAATANAAGGALKTAIDALAPRSSLVAITPWVAYTSNVTSTSGTVTATTQARWRRVGDTAEITFTSSISACTGTGQFQWSLPPGVVADAAKLTYRWAHVGQGMNFSGGIVRPVDVTVDGNTNTLTLEPFGGDGGGMTCADAAAGTANTRAQFAIPVRGWTVAP